METKVEKVIEKVDDLKLKMNKQDEIVEDTRKAADTILLILDKKEIREKKVSCLGKQHLSRSYFFCTSKPS